jgi:hypothetical protein
VAINLSVRLFQNLFVTFGLVLGKAKVLIAIGRKSEPAHHAPIPSAFTTANVFTMPPPAAGRNRNGRTPAIVALIVESGAESVRLIAQ